MVQVPQPVVRKARDVDGACDIVLAADLRAAPGASPQPAALTEHRQGCDALGGYGHGIGPCTCGASPQPADPLGYMHPDAVQHLQSTEASDPHELITRNQGGGWTVPVYLTPQPAAVPGWQWVPVEPTPAMLYPDLQTAGPGTQLGNICADFGRQIWARMLAASPQPPQQGREGAGRA